MENGEVLLNIALYYPLKDDKNPQLRADQKDSTYTSPIVPRVVILEAHGFLDIITTFVCAPARLAFRLRY